MNGMYEELIEKLRKNNRMSGWTHIDRLIDEAAEAIEALQQENNGWRERYDELDAGHSRLFKDFCKLQQENEQLQGRNTTYVNENANQANEDSGLSPEEVQELAKAKADGRLLVLPCKVGTRVWVIGQDCDLCHDMYTEEPCLFGDCEYRKVIESVFLPGMTDDIGKTVFLTREAAQKALEQQKANGRAILGS